MTAQAKTLAAPELKEAKNGVLNVSELEKAAHGVVPPNQQAAVGDEITLRAETSTGNEWKEVYVLTTVDVGKSVVFAIPKIVFEKQLVSGATAKLHYTVVKMGSTPETSQTLTVKLER